MSFLTLDSIAEGAGQGINRETPQQTDKEGKERHRRGREGTLAKRREK